MCVFRGCVSWLCFKLPRCILAISVTRLYMYVVTYKKAKCVCFIYMRKGESRISGKGVWVCKGGVFALVISAYFS